MIREAPGRGGRLVDKVALITGAARGQGAAHARAMVAEGARVVVADVLDDDGMALVGELGPNTRYAHLDVRRNDEWDDAVRVAIEAFGHLEVLVNNAGVLVRGALDTLDDEA